MESCKLTRSKHYLFVQFLKLSKNHWIISKLTYHLLKNSMNKWPSFKKWGKILENCCTNCSPREKKQMKVIDLSNYPFPHYPESLSTVARQMIENEAQSNKIERNDWQWEERYCFSFVVVGSFFTNLDNVWVWHAPL